MVKVRAATAADRSAIRAVHLDAFPTAAEADLVECLLREGDAVISMVAVEQDVVVGHILFSRMSVEADGEPIDALGLAPVAVVPDRQNNGIGGKLIERGMSEALKGKAQMVFLLGEPGYYRRFGFKAETAAPFSSPYAGEYFQAKRLSAGLQLPRSGRAAYAPAFANLS